MISFMQKTIEQVNAEVKEGKAVMAIIDPGTPAADQPEEASAVTTATFANHMHCLPPPPSRLGTQT